MESVVAHKKKLTEINGKKVATFLRGPLQQNSEKDFNYANSKNRFVK